MYENYVNKYTEEFLIVIYTEQIDISRGWMESDRDRHKV